MERERLEKIAQIENLIDDVTTSMNEDKIRDTLARIIGCCEEIAEMNGIKLD